MKETVGIDQIARDLAQKTNLQEEIVRVVLHRLFAHIVTYLEAGEEVGVKGLGVFSMVEDAGGKRYRLRFDESFKSAINQPFSCFEPVVLSRGREIEPEEIEAEEENTPEEQCLTEEALPVEQTQEEKSELQDLPEGKPVENTVAVESTQRMGDLLSAEEVHVDKSLHLRRRKGAIRVNWVCFIGFIFLGVMGVYYVLANTVFNFYVEPVEAVQIVSPKLPEQKLLPEREDTVSVLIEEVVEPVLESEVVVDEAKREEGSALPEQARPESALPESVRLQAGERLTLIAQRYYGSKFFWVYIFDYNKKRYPNPDVIPVGAVLKLPSKAHYSIDANDPKSIERAKELLLQIYR